jgi:hypothetical protein
MQVEALASTGFVSEVDCEAAATGRLGPTTAQTLLSRLIHRTWVTCCWDKSPTDGHVTSHCALHQGSHAGEGPRLAGGRCGCPRACPPPLNFGQRLSERRSSCSTESPDGSCRLHRQPDQRHTERNVKPEQARSLGRHPPDDGLDRKDRGQSEQ